MHCFVCGKETTLRLVIMDEKKELRSYCPESECARNAAFTIGSMNDTVAIEMMEKSNLK